MSSKWTVKPDTRHVELAWTAPDGTEETFSVDFKKYLTIGEERQMLTAGLRRMSTPGARGKDDSPEVSIDWRLQTFSKMATYLADWSLKDDAGRKLPHTVEGLEVLQPSLFKVLDDALDAHVELMEEAKKAPASGGASEPSPTSV